MTLTVGTTWAERYLVEGLLGVGGMGTVYRAVDVLLDGERVALKLLHPHMASDHIQRQRFINEVKLSRKVCHQNVVRTIDLGISEGIPFFSMELVEGKTLRDICSASPLSFPDVCKTLLQIVAGLEAIHDAQILHRDLTSRNLLINQQGVVKIADFGVACEISHDESPVGPIVGSARYLAPEVWESTPVDHRADLYALGVLIYELSTGHVPLDAESAAELMYKHLSDTIPPLNATRPQIPRWFSDLTKALLEKKAPNRPTSVREVADLIRENCRLSTHSEPRQSAVSSPLDEERLPASPITPGLLKALNPPKSSSYPPPRHSTERLAITILAWLVLLGGGILLVFHTLFR